MAGSCLTNANWTMDAILSPGESKEFTLKMTAGVVTAMAGFGMYSYTKLVTARPAEDSRRGEPPLSAAYQPIRGSDSGLRLINPAPYTPVPYISSSESRKL